MIIEKNFCNDDLTDYEKTIYSLAIAFGARGSYIIKESDISNIAVLLSVNENLLNKALTLYKDELFPLKIKFKNDVYTLQNSGYADLFHALINIYFIYKNLDELSEGISYDSILTNYNIFQDCIGAFQILNAITSTFECMHKNYFSLEFAVFNNSNYRPVEHINLLRLFLFENDYHILKKEHLPFIYRIISYDLVTRVNSIYLVTICQIIKHSDFMSNEIKDIADEMYSYLLSIIQNARIISVQTNFLPPLNSYQPEIRDKHNNTTRLQLLYGYENFDSYVLRLDLAHKGQGFIHYNNNSPGGIKCCLFSKEEYTFIVSKNPIAKSFFQKYGNRYGLKERSNLNLSNEEKDLFEKIRSNNEHSSAFENNYTEEDVVSFINTVSLMLPGYCQVNIDTEGIYARHCFNYDKIMYYSTLLEIALLTQDKTNSLKLLKQITHAASSYELISKNSIDNFFDIWGVCLIIDEAKNKAMLHKSQYI